MRVERGTLLLLLGGALVLAAGLLVGIALGDYPLEPAEVLAALVGRGSDAADFIVLGLRLPRLLTAFAVGALLGVSGTILQGVARNPLAAPDIIGVTAGASVGAVLALIIIGSSTLVAPAALVGGGLAAAGVIALSWRGGLTGMRIVLIGIGVNAAALAGVDYLMTRGGALQVSEATNWLVGSLNGASWDDVRLLGLALVVLVPVLLVLGRRLEALRLGDGLAASLGAHVVRDRLWLTAAAVVVAGLAVSVAGPIAFVAFVSPHLARGISRATGGGLLASSAIVGAVIVMGADLVARRAFAPVELPVGLFTVLVGAPYLLWLLRRSSWVGQSA